jgi:hypothetical protein
MDKQPTPKQAAHGLGKHVAKTKRFWYAYTLHSLQETATDEMMALADRHLVKFTRAVGLFNTGQ